MPFAARNADTEVVKTTTIRVRLTEEIARELDELAGEARAHNAAVVNAIHEAYRTFADERMRRESEAIRDDPEDQAEIAAAREAMGSGEAW